ncbi:hypothetical protein LIER_08202 [Lithospermum erythrorhizon]|uniref:Uncharacterized protein n=1 Tax=Lithospermum erythrorhizon TaxID=34254 RepID=A0AAV3PAZ7_LITER
MLEMIRTMLMKRIRDRYVAISKKPGPLCVKTKKILDLRMAESVGFVASWNDKFGFEVKTGGDQYIVDGIPCSHSISCLIQYQKSMTASVKGCYKKETFLIVHSHVINPMNGMALWDKDSGMSLQPPPQMKLAGRPKKNKRRNITEIKKKGKKEALTRWVIGHCSWCKQRGHNIRKCPSKEKGEDKVDDGKSKWKPSRVVIDECNDEPNERGKGFSLRRGTASSARGRGNAATTDKGRGMFHQQGAGEMHHQRGGGLLHQEAGGLLHQEGGRLLQQGAEGVFQQGAKATPQSGEKEFIQPCHLKMLQPSLNLML